MPRFAYRAKNAEGKLIKGELVSTNRQTAILNLRQQGLWIVGLKETGSKKIYTHKISDWVNNRLFYYNLGTKHRIMFLRQLEVLLKSGFPLHEALNIIASGKTQDAYHMLVLKIKNDVMDGQSLYHAMHRFEQIFSDSVCQLVKIGEACGNLDEVLQQVADIEEKNYIAKEKTKSLLIYPVIILFISIMMIILLIAFVLPVFSDFLLNFHADLPLPTRILLTIGAFTLNDWLRLIVFLVIGIILARLLYSQRPFRIWFDEKLLHLPLWGQMQISSEWLRLTGILAVALKSGIPINKALHMLKNVAGNYYLKDFLDYTHREVERGQSFAALLPRCQAVPPLVYEFIKAGENAGNLEYMLERATLYAQSEVDKISERLRALLEPTMILVLGGIIMFVISAIMLPLMSVMDVLV